MVANRLGTNQRGRGGRFEGSPTDAAADRRNSARIQERESRRRSALETVSEGKEEGEQLIYEDDDEPSDTAVETAEEHQEIKKKDVEEEQEDIIKKEEIDTSPITLSPGTKDIMREKWGEHAKAQEEFLARKKPPLASSSSSSGLPAEQVTTAQNTKKIALTHQPSQNHSNNDAMMVLLKEMREQQEQMLLMFSAQQQEIHQVKTRMLESENQMAIINSSQVAISEILDDLHRRVSGAQEKQTTQEKMECYV